MANRLSKIVTRGGDKGQTSLGDGTRVSKSDPRVALLGDVDELNSWIGVVIEHLDHGPVRDLLKGVQHDLFDLGGALCFPEVPVLSAVHIERLDVAAAALNKDLPPLKEFVLPGGAPFLGWLHVARATCRRVERAMVDFYQSEPNVANALQYLNRLSDYLFIAARFEARRLEVEETLWQKEFSLGK